MENMEGHLVWICTIILSAALKVYSDECIHDKLQRPRVPIQSVTYDMLPAENDQNRKRSKRADVDWYRPIRIFTFYSDLDLELELNEIIRLKEVVDKGVGYINKILSVIPVNGSLLLQRTGCLKSWGRGKNVGKCAALDRKYSGEYCQDNLKIPDDHLEGLYVWNRTYPEPVYEFYSPGEGALADYILYVRSVTTSHCFSAERNKLLAYASYCQLDQNDRPIAGYINICPTVIKSQDISWEKIYQTVMHELFHALGFSKKLFQKFKDCSISDGGINCSARPDPVIQTVANVKRLTTPMVISRMKEHFNCTTLDKFGGPIEVKNGEITSHWDEKFLYGSIMAAKLGQPHLTSVDPITLAALEDSGWYKVDYTMADQYFWGKDAGCYFGSPDTCNTDTTSYFCNTSIVGCHYLHKDKAKCDYIDSSNNCKVFQAGPEDGCFVSKDDKDLEDDTEIYTDSSLCFLSNLTASKNDNHPDNLIGKCYDHRCNSDETLEVQIKRSSWYPCPYGSSISIPDYHGVIKCPDKKEIICPFIPLLTTTLFHTSTTVSMSGALYKVSLVFEANNVSVGAGEITREILTKCFKELIVNVTMIKSDRIQNMMIIKEEEEMMTFDLITDNPDIDESYQKLYNAVIYGNLTMNLTHDGFSVITVTNIFIQKKTTTENISSTSCGFSHVTSESLFIVLIYKLIVQNVTV